jgi:hypothetical protein
MTPGQLVKAVSIALDVPEETVVQHDRNLVVAGLRTTGARGRNAPDVTHLDAARLFVAVLGSVRTKDSVSVVKEFERTIYSHFQGPFTDEPDDIVDTAITNLPKRHNLVEGLAAVIADASQPIDDLQSYLRRFGWAVVICRYDWRGASGGIVRSDQAGHYVGWAAYSLPHAPPDKSREERETLSRSVIEQERRAHGPAILILGAAFRDNGLRYANAREAYLDGYGTKSGTIVRRAAKKKSKRKVA